MPLPEPVSVQEPAGTPPWAPVHTSYLEPRDSDKEKVILPNQMGALSAKLSIFIQSLGFGVFIVI
jgi:hypothetical protein